MSYGWEGNRGYVGKWWQPTAGFMSQDYGTAFNL